MEMAPEQGTRESVGGSSRDGERGTRNPRRTASSGGFLVDSFMPRSKSLRASGQHHNRPETDLRGKRGTPEAESTPKKRSRFRWSRHRESTKESDDVGPNAVGDKEEDTGSCHFAEDVTVPESRANVPTENPCGAESGVADLGSEFNTSFDAVDAEGLLSFTRSSPEDLLAPWPAYEPWLGMLPAAEERPSPDEAHVPPGT